MGRRSESGRERGYGPAPDSPAADGVPRYEQVPLFGYEQVSDEVFPFWVAQPSVEAHPLDGRQAPDDD